MFRYDPLSPWTDSDSALGLYVRNEILHRPKPRDTELRRTLAAPIRNSQLKNGSWNNALYTTLHMLDSLADLGIEANDPCVERGLAWIDSLPEVTYKEKYPGFWFYSYRTENKAVKGLPPAHFGPG